MGLNANGVPRETSFYLRTEWHGIISYNPLFTVPWPFWRLDPAPASEHHGIVKFAGLPVPGATITATMGDKKLVAVTDPQGVYSFPDLPDGVWNLQVEMLCFSTLKNEVAIAPNSPSPEWELKLLPFDEIKASAPPSGSDAGRQRRRHRLPHRSANGRKWRVPSLLRRINGAAPPKKGSKAAKAAAATAAAPTACRISARRSERFQRAAAAPSGTRGGRSR